MMALKAFPAREGEGDRAGGGEEGWVKYAWGPSGATQTAVGRGYHSPYKYFETLLLSR